MIIEIINIFDNYLKLKYFINLYILLFQILKIYLSFISYFFSFYI